MQQDVVTVGVDLAKNVFQVHVIGAGGTVLIRRQLRRAEVLKFFSSLPTCLVGMEACASAHHWGRELLALGHDVRLVPPAYVKPYVKRGKTEMPILRRARLLFDSAMWWYDRVPQSTDRGRDLQPPHHSH